MKHIKWTETLETNCLNNQIITKWDHWQFILLWANHFYFNYTRWKRTLHKQLMIFPFLILKIAKGSWSFPIKVNFKALSNCPLWHRFWLFKGFLFSWSSITAKEEESCSLSWICTMNPYFLKWDSFHSLYNAKQTSSVAKITFPNVNYKEFYFWKTNVNFFPNETP